MDFAAAFQTDATAEEKGRWYEFGDVEFLIARSGNRKSTDMFQQQFTAHKHTLDLNDTPEQRLAAEERATTIQVDVMAAAILLGWRGREIKDETVEGGVRVGKVLFEGIELEYNQANAKKMLRMKDFRAWVNTKSGDFKNYLAKVKEEDAKN